MQCNCSVLSLLAAYLLHVKQLPGALQPACLCQTEPQHVTARPKVLRVCRLLLWLQVSLGNVPGFFLPLISTHRLLLLLLMILLGALPASLTTTSRWCRKLKLVLLLLPHPHHLLIISRLTLNLHSGAQHSSRGSALASIL